MMFLVVFQPFIAFVSGKPLNLLNAGSFRPVLPNYCNNSTIMSESGLIRANMGQFLGYECSSEFFQCRWESDGFRTYRKRCTAGLVYDVLGTQNCNYDYNVKTCGIKNGVHFKRDSLAKLFAGPLVSITFSGPASCNSTSFHCSQSEQCVPLSKRCDGHYDCLLEEDEQNCREFYLSAQARFYFLAMCLASEFACVVSEQCVQFSRRCNGISECNDGTDEKNCDVCGNGLFHCAKSDECIPKGLRCDGIRQCPHGEDELLCKFESYILLFSEPILRSTTNRRFTCLSLEEYIPMTQVCDGIPQCIDGSDELYCSMGTGNEQPPASSMCEKVHTGFNTSVL
uniref:Chitin-binding type-2 domain-containing protein n=1 Tax=Angiostrongylus cantonensis TaxID=6313 RepID=A0A0K0DFV6_ANGCA